MVDPDGAEQTDDHRRPGPRGKPGIAPSLREPGRGRDESDEHEAQRPPDVEHASCCVIDIAIDGVRECERQQTAEHEEEAVALEPFVEEDGSRDDRGDSELRDRIHDVQDPRPAVGVGRESRSDQERERCEARRPGGERCLHDARQRSTPALVRPDHEREGEQGDAGDVAGVRERRIRRRPVGDQLVVRPHGLARAPGVRACGERDQGSPKTEIRPLRRRREAERAGKGRKKDREDVDHSRPPRALERECEPGRDPDGRRREEGSTELRDHVQCIAACCLAGNRSFRGTCTTHSGEDLRETPHLVRVISGSAIAGSPSRRPACACRRRACSSRCARACARSRPR